ncbi:uncharacterized protein LOC125500004 isoform X7 [Athalia rosae]|nr:uncharacterized protein LOC125500004 isoform X7 [Athalia rosae]
MLATLDRKISATVDVRRWTEIDLRSMDIKISQCFAVANHFSTALRRTYIASHTSFTISFMFQVPGDAATIAAVCPDSP